MTTHKDPEGRPTVFEHLPPHLPRLISVGRLDYDSEGLLLLTNSGELSRELELPKNAQARSYRVRVNGQVRRQAHPPAVARRWSSTMKNSAPSRSWPDTEKVAGRNRWLTVTLHEGRNREIRRLFEFFGYPVSRLIRVGYAGLELGKLHPGEVEEVDASEVEDLIERLAHSTEKRPAHKPRELKRKTGDRP